MSELPVRSHLADILRHDIPPPRHTWGGPFPRRPELVCYADIITSEGSSKHRLIFFFFCYIWILHFYVFVIVFILCRF